MDSDIKVTPEELKQAKRSLEIWRKSYDEETKNLMHDLKSKSGGTKRKKNKSRKSHKIR